MRVAAGACGETAHQNLTAHSRAKSIRTDRIAVESAATTPEQIILAEHRQGDTADVDIVPDAVAGAPLDRLERANGGGVAADVDGEGESGEDFPQPKPKRP